ncbi:MAG: hypothetical protein Fur009_1720 [Candidatus Microgenomates bacterium]
MFKSEISFYLGEEKQGGFSAVIAQDNLFLCFEIYTGVEVDQGYKIVDYIKNKVKEKLVSQKYLINSLSEFDDFISQIITENNFPAGFSISAGYLKDNILYLKTIGEGKVIIRRDKKYGLLLHGDNTASGEIKNTDFFVFTTDNFLNLIGGRVKIEEIFADKKPKEIIDEITPIIKNKNDQGAVAVLLEFLESHHIDEENNEVILEEKLAPNFLPTIKTYFLAMKNSKKTLTIILAFFLFGLLIWSMMIGVKKKNSLIIEEKVKKANELISQKLEMAENVAFLNMDRALVLLKESKNEFDLLKKEADNLKVKNNKIDELAQKIQNTENKIIKKQQAEYDEFFDLSIDDKNASADKVYLYGETAFILDKKQGVIYKLSLEKKSLEKINFQELKQASLISSFADEIYFYIKENGIYQIKALEKPKKIISFNKDLGEIVDMILYNGNLYLLDKDKDEVWKYVRLEGGFSDKNSYFQKGEAVNLTNIYSMAIDGSIYLAGENIILKFTSGARDSFKYDLPATNFNFSKIFTNRDLEKIYLLDKINSKIYVLGKTGEYIEQINSDIFKNINDFVVYKDEIYVFYKNKIFKIK